MKESQATPAKGFHHGHHAKTGGLTHHKGKAGKTLVSTPSNAKALGKAGK